jgi:hypothetical protein
MFDHWSGEKNTVLVHFLMVFAIARTYITPEK